MSSPSVRAVEQWASAFLVHFSLALPLAASKRTWSGAVNGLWSEPGSWGGAAPVAGDALVFPAGASHQTCTNGLPAGTVFLSMAFTGGTYTVGGSSLTPGAGGISTSGAHVTFTGPIVFSGSVVIDGGGPGGSITFAGPVTGTPTQVSLVGSGSLRVASGNTLRLTGPSTAPARARPAISGSPRARRSGFP